jgi:hypothetical protein
MILQGLTQELQDKPDVQDRINAVFGKWFRNLLAQGQMMIDASKAQQEVYNQEGSAQGQQPQEQGA